MLPDSILPTPEDDIARILRDYERRLSHLETLEAAGAWTKIEDIDLSVAAANFDFQNIASSFISLRLIAYLRGDNASSFEFANVRFNNDGGDNYDYIDFEARHNNITFTREGIAVTAILAGVVDGSTSPANFFSVLDLICPNYANTNGFKTTSSKTTWIATGATTNIRVTRSSGWWRDTAAIDRLTLFPGAGANWLASSRATLYGVL